MFAEVSVSFFYTNIKNIKTKLKIESYLYNKRVRPTKNEPQQGISYLEREREGVREKKGQAGRRADRSGRSAGMHIYG